MLVMHLAIIPAVLPIAGRKANIDDECECAELSHLQALGSQRLLLSSRGIEQRIAFIASQCQRSPGTGLLQQFESRHWNMCCLPGQKPDKAPVFVGYLHERDAVDLNGFHMPGGGAHTIVILSVECKLVLYDDRHCLYTKRLNETFTLRFTAAN